jgi:hypothetical protein
MENFVVQGQSNFRISTDLINVFKINSLKVSRLARFQITLDVVESKINIINLYREIMPNLKCHDEMLEAHSSNQISKSSKFIQLSIENNS